jgi:hypothetical protein
MNKNPYKTLDTNPTGLVETWNAVTPNNSTDNVGAGNVAIGLYVTVGGAVSFNDVNGTTITVSVPSNFYINCSVSRVLSTGTTATGIFALISA